MFSGPKYIPSAKDGLSKEQETLFYLDQIYEKARIRAVENRRLPIDELALCIWGLSPDSFHFRPLTLNTKLGKCAGIPSNLKIPNPFTLLSALSEDQLRKEILDPVQNIVDAIIYVMAANKRIREREESLEFSSLDYWNAARTATQYFITKKSSALSQSVIHASVIGDVRELFKEVAMTSLEPKSQMLNLSLLQKDVKARLYSHEPNFWEAVIFEIEVFKARILLSSQYRRFCKTREAIEDSLPQKNEDQKSNADEPDTRLLEDDHPQAIRQQLSYASSKLEELEESYGAVPVLNFNTEDPDRKYIPRYFSRVFAGFDWNRYNQTHYDQQNPPPKYIQGYKFVIFYPRLLEQASAAVPAYELCDSTGNEILSDLVPHDFPLTKSTEIITFTAPPPYVNISFKIVKDIWECSHRKGFKCYYENGLLYLEFHFKKNIFKR